MRRTLGGKAPLPPSRDVMTKVLGPPQEAVHERSHGSLVRRWTIDIYSGEHTQSASLVEFLLNSTGDLHTAISILLQHPLSAPYLHIHPLTHSLTHTVFVTSIMASLNTSSNGPNITRSYQNVINTPPPSGPQANSPTYGQWAVFTVAAPLVSAFQQDGGKESVLKVQTTGGTSTCWERIQSVARAP
jgi:hypothetical protein